MLHLCYMCATFFYEMKYNQIYTFYNLLKAFKKAKKGSKKNRKILQYSFKVEKNLLELKQKIQNKNYQPTPYQYFEVYFPKNRVISVATFEDRIVHHALINILEPMYEKIFINDSYATRKNKGTHKAREKAQKMLQKNNFFWKADILKYFDNIDHIILIKIIQKKVKDNDIIELIEKILQNANDQKKGLPIGNLTSQFFANVYLDVLDHYCKEILKIKNYIRYMDDFVLFHQSKNQIKIWKKNIIQFLKQELKLEIKEKECFLNHHLNGLSFLGVRIFRNIIRIKQQNLRRIKISIRNLKYQFIKNKITELEYSQRLQAYYQIFQYYNIKPNFKI